MLGISSFDSDLHSFDQDLGSDASSVPYRGSDHGWIDLGVIEDMDKPGIRREERARVLVRHVIADLVKEAYPLMSFDVGSLRATVNLKFRYERVFGFCKTCGMLKHGSTGCKGPPNMSGVVLLDGGSGGAVGSVVEASGSSPTQNPNPNKSMVRAKGGQRTPSLVATTPRGSNIPAVTNLFGRAVFVHLFPPRDLGGGPRGRVQLSRFKLPSNQPGGDAGEAQVQLSNEIEMVANITCTKRGVDMETGNFFQRSRCDSLMLKAQPPKLAFAPEFNILHMHGTLTISPAKKRRAGRPVGLKNKPKTENSLGSKRARKRTFGARRMLALGGNSDSGS